MITARDFVTVVSGVPRSGTSLAMQMLRAGGMPVLADDARPADADNPAGYLEYAPVSGTARDASWVADAPGKAVKVIYALLQHLPPGFEYRVLWMRRDLGEVIASQEVMLARRGIRPDEGISRARLEAVFAAQISETETWLSRQSSFQMLSLDLGALIGDPRRAAGEIDAFLSCGLAVEGMAACVDPTLYRQRRQ